MSLFNEKPNKIEYLQPLDLMGRRGWYYSGKMDPWLEKVQLELERLEALKMWANANYVKGSKAGRSNQVNTLFELVEGREGHRVCANCGVYTDNFCIIEKGPPEVNWIEDVWVRMGMLGKPVCGECYYQ